MGSQALALPEFRIGFPMAQEPQADAWLRAQTERALRRLVATLGEERLRAVILAGSLARGEGSAMASRDGLVAVADLDLYAVARSEADAAALREARHRFLRESSADSLRADVGIATERDLAALPDTIANVSLSRSGRVVWGDDTAARCVRRADPARIPREDALHLVLNRAAEELAALRAWERDPQSEAAAFALFYRGVKTTADTALAFLIARGVCDPEYRGRAARIERLIAEDTGIARCAPANFARDVEAACGWKLAPALTALDGHLPGTAGYPAEPRQALAQRVAIVDAFCRWYAGKGCPDGAGESSDASTSHRSTRRAAAATPSDSSDSPRWLDALDALERSEPLPRVARAWVRSARRSSSAARELVRRIASGRLRPTPRLSAQLAALWLYLAGNEPPRIVRARAARLLPPEAAAPGASRDALADAAVAAWGREIMNWRPA